MTEPQRVAPSRRVRGNGRALTLGVIASAALHAALAWWVSSNRVAFPRPAPPPPPPTLVVFSEPVPDPPPEVRIPAPATPIPRPAEPGSEPDRGVLEVLPPSVEPPEVIPHDVPPRLVNGPLVSAALQAGYPDGLPDAAANSLLTLWLFVDTGGRVTKLRVQRSSGFEELDALAVRIAPRMAYSPALHRGRRVAVWVAQRIRFQPPGGDRGGRPSGPRPVVPAPARDSDLGSGVSDRLPPRVTGPGEERVGLVGPPGTGPIQMDGSLALQQRLEAGP